MKTKIELTSASLGTGTTKTQINGANAYQIDEEIMELALATFYQAETAAHTAGECIQTVAFIESPDVAVDPKRIALEGIPAGLGTAPNALISALEDFPVNIPVKPGNRIKVWGQEMVANTAAPRLGANFSTLPQRSGKPQAYWDVSGSDTPAVTSLGTAAARVQLTNITVQDALKLVRTYGRIFPTTVTASEDYIMYLEWICSGFKGAAPLQHALQPIASNLGTAIGLGTPVSREEEIERDFKSRAQQVVQTFVNVEEALTGNGKIIAGICYTK